MRISFVAAVALGAAACSSSSNSTGAPATCTGAVITVPVLGVHTVSAADAPCVSLTADGSTYIVVPQYASGTGSQSVAAYELGTELPAAPDVSPMVAGTGDGTRLGLLAPARGIRQRFDFLLRDKERQFANAGAHVAAPPAAAVAAPLLVGDRRIFDVCSDLSCGTFKKDTAFAQYVGGSVAIYISQNAPASGLSPSDITALGNTFDADLYPIDVNGFGAPSDIDLNGKVIVLMTPKVNAITPASQCSTLGYVAGFFYGLDLIPTQPHSNAGEIFYSIVPDPSGSVSCVHTVATVKLITLATFIHEFQHMISWNQHVIVRGGLSEDTWLNEGMSHIAEELGSRYYEHKYPPPNGRTDPAQLFPDSSQGFISGDLENSYSYLESPAQSSVTLFANSGSLEERGAAWLFLRWLGDLKDSTIYHALDQTVLTGVANVEAQSGETFQALFGDFTMAVYSDSLPGMPRATAPARDRFVSRNLRQIYDRIYQTSLGGLPRPFPVLAMNVPVSAKTTSSMIVGSMEYWRLTMPASGSDLRLHFQKAGGGSFPSTAGAQVTVLHCPSASACPQ